MTADTGRTLVATVAIDVGSSKMFEPVAGCVLRPFLVSAFFLGRLT